MGQDGPLGQERERWGAVGRGRDGRGTPRPAQVAKRPRGVFLPEWEWAQRTGREFRLQLNLAPVVYSCRLQLHENLRRITWALLKPSFNRLHIHDGMLRSYNRLHIHDGMLLTTYYDVVPPTVLLPSYVHNFPSLRIGSNPRLSSLSRAAAVGRLSRDRLHEISHSLRAECVFAHCLREGDE